MMSRGEKVVDPRGLIHGLQRPQFSHILGGQENLIFPAASQAFQLLSGYCHEEKEGDDMWIYVFEEITFLQ